MPMDLACGCGTQFEQIHHGLGYPADQEQLECLGQQGEVGLCHSLSHSARILGCPTKLVQQMVFATHSSLLAFEHLKSIVKHSTEV